VKGIFVSGTGTDVGKTVASAILLTRALRLFVDAAYYKPIQTGPDDDAHTIAQLLNDQSMATRGLTFKRPLSPHMAAHYDNSYIEMSSVVSSLPKRSDFLIVEGAGGLMVPINHRYLMIDLIKALSLPCLLVANTKLGTINHTLLSLAALRAKRIPVHGVIMMGDKDRDNEASIRAYGRVENLLALPTLPIVNPVNITNVACTYRAAIDRFLQAGC